MSSGYFLLQEADPMRSFDPARLPKQVQALLYIFPGASPANERFLLTSNGVVCARRNAGYGR